MKPSAIWLEEVDHGARAARMVGASRDGCWLWPPHGLEVGQGGLVHPTWFGVELGKFGSRLVTCSSPKVRMKAESVMHVKNDSNETNVAMFGHLEVFE
ncbi:hypothetical protein CDL15_Pgr026289 [Punica granatum]|uniref:Uncharacterized protein n=1 Tax=Punica granatum TaxID=22663 RepID=A0A218XWU6_PUNGR|nr:hypothetical protein CDL15_Pgr026289 [Punica granatum]